MSARKSRFRKGFRFAPFEIRQKDSSTVLFGPKTCSSLDFSASLIPQQVLFFLCTLQPDSTLDLDETTNANELGEDGVPTSFFLRKEKEESVEYAIRIFKRVFDDDIQAVLGIQVPYVTPVFCLHFFP